MGLQLSILEYKIFQYVISKLLNIYFQQMYAENSFWNKEKISV